MATHVVMNNGDSLGFVLQENLKHADNFLASTAYLNAGGLGWVMDSVNQLLDRQGQVCIVHGFYPRITETEAIRGLAELAMDYPSNMTYQVYMSQKLTREGAFHAKMYLADSGDGCRAVVGSSNLTQGGLSSNLEVNCILTGKSNDREIQQCRSIFDKIQTHEHLHRPNAEWINLYDELRQLELESDDKSEADRARTHAQLFELARQEPLHVESQVDCVVLGLHYLSSRNPPGAFFHLEEINVASAPWAIGKYSETNWPNSVRRVLNTNTIHKGVKSKQLFERVDGEEGRSGCYRLSEKGWRYLRNLQK